MSISGSIRSYYFNKAVWLFGSTLDQQLEEISSKTKKAATAKVKQTMLLTQWLDDGQSAGLYKDPAASM